MTAIRNNIKTLVIIISLMLASANVNSQITGDFPEIGKPCPDFTLNVSYSSKKMALLNDFKGKWLVLDLFTTGCTSCFTSFPKVNQLKKDFEGKVEFLLVGKDDKYVRPSYEKYREKLHLDLPVAYDTTLFNRFGITHVPYIVIVDGTGIVRAISSSVNKELLSDLIAGKDPEYNRGENKWQEAERLTRYDWEKPLLINGNGGEETDFLHRSILMKYTGNYFGANVDHISARTFRKFGKLQVVGLPLSYLYDLAYGDTLFRFPHSRPNCYGKYWRTPILELTDSSEFNWKYGSTKNMYSYSLIAPQSKISTAYLKKVMQNDLMMYFGYSVSVEDRMMPCWYLTVKDDVIEKVKTKGINLTIENQKDIPRNTGFQILNKPVSNLVEILEGYFQTFPPFYDRTGIIGNIDLEITGAIITDFESIKKSLEDKGFILTPGSAEMKVIVVRDPKE